MDLWLQALRRVVDQETASLAKGNVENEPAFLLQQIRNRAVACGFSELAGEAERRLGTLGLPWLAAIIPSGEENPALVRTLPGSLGDLSTALTSDGRATLNRVGQRVEIRDVETGVTLSISALSARVVESGIYLGAIAEGSITRKAFPAALARVRNRISTATSSPGIRFPTLI